VSQRITGCRCCNAGCPTCNYAAGGSCVNLITPGISGAGCSFTLPTLFDSDPRTGDFNIGATFLVFYPDALTDDHDATILIGCDPATGNYSIRINLNWFNNGPATACTCATGGASVQNGRWTFTGVAPVSLVCGGAFFFDSGPLSAVDDDGCAITLSTRVTIAAGACP
jgi:hypothetical protein